MQANIGGGTTTPSVGPHNYAKERHQRHRTAHRRVLVQFLVG